MIIKIIRMYDTSTSLPYRKKRGWFIIIYNKPVMAKPAELKTIRIYKLLRKINI